MAIQFAKDEKVIKSFNYAAAGYNKKKGTHEAFKNLIVTNKRVIHEAVRDSRGNEIILRQELPVTDAKYIKTTMGKTSSPKFLVQANIFAFFTIASVVVSLLEFASKFQFVFWLAAVILGVFAIVKLVEFFKSMSTIVSFSIYTDHTITPVLTTTEEDGNYEKNADGKKKNTPALEIRVNGSVAREIADGLGAAILDAIAYKEEDSIQETAEEVPAFAEIETEEIPVDLPAPEEEAEEAKEVAEEETEE